MGQLYTGFYMTHCINKDQPSLWLAWHTGEGFSIQSDFYLAQGYEIGCEAVDTRFGGSIPLAPLQGTYHPKIIRVCEESVMGDLFDPM